MKTAALYARVSTNKQDTETQLHTLQEYADRRGLTTFHYSDVVSSSKGRRFGLDRLMDDARQRRFDCVIVARFDRFARSTRELLTALEEFQALGIDFVSFSESIDTSTPMGKMVFVVLGAVAELERNIIRERVKMGISRARAKGKQLGRPKAIIDREKVDRLFLEGFTVTQIAVAYGVSQRTIRRILKDRTGDEKQSGKNPSALFAHFDSFQTTPTRLTLEGKNI